MVKTQSNERIEEEEYSLKQAQDELKSLKEKWVKLPSTLRFIEFLEHYIKEKEKFIQKLRDFNYRKD